MRINDERHDAFNDERFPNTWNKNNTFAWINSITGQTEQSGGITTTQDHKQLLSTTSSNMKNSHQSLYNCKVHEVLRPQVLCNRSQDTLENVSRNQANGQNLCPFFKI